MITGRMTILLQYVIYYIVFAVGFSILSSSARIASEDVFSHAIIFISRS